MENYTLFAKSSSGDFYSVVFEINNQVISVSCSCMAGEMGQMCKHKDGFINGDSSMLFYPEQSAVLSFITTSIENSNLIKEYKKLFDGLNQIENQKKELAKQAKMLKAAFARKLANGI